MDDVQVGMIITQDVRTEAGLLLRRGERVTTMIEQRLRNFALTVGSRSP